MLKAVLGLVMVAGLCFPFYYLGRSQAEIKLIKEQVEVIKYVEKERAAIQAKPNAGRDDLLKLMRAGKL